MNLLEELKDWERLKVEAGYQDLTVTLRLNKIVLRKKREHSIEGLIVDEEILESDSVKFLRGFIAGMTYLKNKDYESART